MRLTEAQQQLVEQHWPQVRRIAADFEYKYGPLADWLSEASLGACQAAATFDPARGQFNTILYCRVRGACFDALRQFHPAGYRRKKSGQVVPVKLGTIDDHKLYRVDPRSLEFQELEEAADEVRGIARRLGNRAEKVLAEMYLHGKKMKATGAALGLSESRISQIHAQALDCLRKSLCV